MRLGCCGTLEEAGVIRDAGFDFLEVIITDVLRGDEPSSVWDKTAPKKDSLALPIEAANRLLPASHPVIGPRRDMNALTEYMKRIASRAEQIGIKRLVFGSGAARNKPEGVTQEQAISDIIEFSTMAAEVCAPHNVMIVLEHLNAGECNMINKLDEERAVCEAVGHPNFMALVDSYHYGLEKDTEQAVLDLGTMIRHVHLGEPDGRGEPGVSRSPETAFDFDDFFCLLRKTGYDERISIESNWSGPLAEKAPAVVKRLRDSWTAAGQCES